MTLFLCVLLPLLHRIGEGVAARQVVAEKALLSSSLRTFRRGSELATIMALIFFRRDRGGTGWTGLYNRNAPLTSTGNSVDDLVMSLSAVATVSGNGQASALHPSRLAIAPRRCA